MSKVETKGDLQTKRWACVVCKKKGIAESRVEHRLPADEVPDVGGCDYSTYTDHKVTGGKLLEVRPDVPWESWVYDLVVCSAWWHLPTASEDSIRDLCRTSPSPKNRRNKIKSP